jgi:hypothetical protein
MKVFILWPLPAVDGRIKLLLNRINLIPLLTIPQRPQAFFTTFNRINHSNYRET